MKKHSLTALLSALASLSYAQGFTPFEYIYIGSPDSIMTTPVTKLTAKDLRIKPDRSRSWALSPCDSCIQAANVQWYVDSISLEAQYGKMLTYEPFINGEGEFIMTAYAIKDTTDAYSRYTQAASAWRNEKNRIITEYGFYSDKREQQIANCRSHCK